MAANGGVRRPRRVSPRRVAPHPGQLSFDLGLDDFGAPPQAPNAGSTKRIAPRPQTSSAGRRNLRALQAFPRVEELPNLLPFESSRVAEAGYSRQSHTLYVRFVDGTPWQYNNVEPNVWRNFRRSASAGRYINRVLNNYSYGRSQF
jgi:hypothetical protein